MEKLVEIPEGVEVRIENKTITVRGPKGEISKDFSTPLFDRKVSIEKTNGNVKITSTVDNRKTLAFVNTIAAHVRNMVIGVTKGYKYTMKIHYVHFPITVEISKQDNETKLEVKNFLGRKKPIVIKVRDVDVKLENDYIIIRGIDKEKVGEAVNRIERSCRIYREHDRRIFQDGIFLVKKEIDEGEER